MNGPRNLARGGRSVKVRMERVQAMVQALKEEGAGAQEAAHAATHKADKLPTTNKKGWVLHIDKDDNQAYVSPDGKSYEEAK